MSVAFKDLAKTDLFIDAIFEGGRIHKNVKDDPLQHILKCGNQGGIRYKELENLLAKLGTASFSPIS